ncbi:DUF4843 domain-containing protein [Chitinophaga barathri]|uniref:DUF4843 domain-containing protein n=1 Tax=Chitinophaga barathri TaxID=1647451 RepID=A0A3N4MHQ6_9BACT|nr:DUF4843 domain-containing protein [Chitinophaga barathri]RPD39620.1 DUF4843 domain-containing protein [Chitinophaga barathri]
MKLHHIAILFALLGLAACSQDERLVYQEDPRVYFSKFSTNPDSTDYSFAVKDASLLQDTVWLTMRVMGSAAVKDREIRLRVSDTSKAREGYHFNFGPLVMPANAFEARLPVILYRKPGLRDSVLTIDLAVEESKDFKPGYNDRPTTSSPIDRLHYKISVTDQLLKPARWDVSLAASFGTYSQVKFRFMILETGKTNWNETIFPGDMQFLIQTVKYALYKYEETNGPLLDENGVRVVFP